MLLKILECKYFLKAQMLVCFAVWLAVFEIQGWQKKSEMHQMTSKLTLTPIKNTLYTPS